MTAGLIVNPSSGKASGKGLALASALEGKTGVTVRILENFGDLARHLDDFARAQVDTLFISSGDGTVQAIQTDLAERKPFAKAPRLALLPHGTTNMTAADLGFRRRPAAAQAEFIAGGTPTDLAERPTLRAANPRDGRVRHGMFLGTGAVWQATLFTQSSVHGTGLKGEWATFATLAGAVAKALFARPAPDDIHRIDRPHAMRVTAGGVIEADGPRLMLLATTLEKLILGTRPFWGGKRAPLRVSIFPYPVPSIVRWLWSTMYGAENRRAPEGSASFSCDAFAIATACPFVIDGEFFDAPEREPLRVETGPMFTYVRG